MTNVFLSLVCILVPAAGVLLLEYYLSTRRSIWPGLIMPFLTAFFSIVVALSFAAFQSYVTTPAGTEVLHQGGALLSLLIALLYLNIPTVFLLVIYFLCRARFNHKREVDKMNIQDL